MTLYETISVLKKLALTQPNVRDAKDGSIYDIMNANPSCQYSSVVITQNTHREVEMFDRYGLTIFYVDRLVDNLEGNRLQIQSIGKEVLSNMINTFCTDFDVECDEISYTPFTEKFVDECAGVYCSITLEIPKDTTCAEYYEEGVIPVPPIYIHNQTKALTITHNGITNVTYDDGYTGLDLVEITVDVPQEGGYDEGYADGMEAQKAKLTDLTITNNGTYEREDGYKKVVVDVPQEGGYEEGFEDGKEAQKAIDDAAITPTTAITSNGTYTADYGFKQVVVNVPQSEITLQNEKVANVTSTTETIHPDEGYDGMKSCRVNSTAVYNNGQANGILQQKAKLATSAFTENGTYTREDGWKEIAINVSDRYVEGYADGTSDQKAKLATSAFTSNGTFRKEDGWKEITINVPSSGGNIQPSKNVSAPSSQSYTITPDAGYDGVAQIIVDNMTPIIAGMEAGVAEQKAKLISDTFTQNGTYTREDGWNEVIVNVAGGYDDGFRDGLEYASELYGGPSENYLKVYYNIQQSGETVIIGDGYPLMFKMSVDGGEWEDVASSYTLTQGEHMIKFECDTTFGVRSFGTRSYFTSIKGHKIVLPHKAVSLNLSAFREVCENVTTIVFGRNFSNIIFTCDNYNTPNINRIEFYNNVPTGFPALCDDNRWKCAENGILVVPAEYLSAYQSAIEGSDFENWTVYPRI